MPRPRKATSSPRLHDADSLSPGAGAHLDQTFRALNPVHADAGAGVWLAHGDCMQILPDLAASFPDGVFDAVFADPPYFLSNDGITCHAGTMVKVNKGSWDRSRGVEENHEFNRAWLAACQRLLRPNGTIWVSGTHHVILSVGFAMQQLGMKILNTITWEKPNPPPNLSCRYFTHSTETLLWAAKSTKSKHVFNYAEMRAENGGRQMKSVWRMLAPLKTEKSFGKHPTQKPLALVQRCIEASTHAGGLVLDPFVGSGTTALAALKTGRRCLGLDADRSFLDVARARVAGAGSRHGAGAASSTSTNAGKLANRGAVASG